MKSTPVLMVVAVMAACFDAEPAAAQTPGKTPAGPPTAGQPAGRWNLPSPTLGGKQFWADQLVFRGWRIQRHVWTGHHRLLDERDIRRAWGSFDACRSTLERLRREQELAPLRRRVILVLHGLVRTRTSLNAMCAHLAKEFPDADVLRVGYPSTRAPLAEHAHSLSRVIDQLGPEVSEIDLVAHSMGNLVVRHYLADHADPAGCGPDPRIRRMVMIAPPNHGSRRAEAWADNEWFRTVLGTAAEEIADWKDLAGCLATPRCEFGILAGAKGDGRGWKDYLPGDDDGTVSVATTRLAGARDFATVPVRHTFILNNRRVQEYTAGFLRHGYFVSERQRQPVLDDPRF